MGGGPCVKDGNGLGCTCNGNGLGCEKEQTGFVREGVHLKGTNRSLIYHALTSVHKIKQFFSTYFVSAPPSLFNPAPSP